MGQPEFFNHGPRLVAGFPRGDGLLRIELAGQHGFDHGFLQLHRMPDPDEIALFVDEERGGNRSESGGAQPAFRHAPLSAVRFVVQGHAVGHPVSHRLHQGGDGRLGGLPNVLADDHEPLVFDLPIQVVEMRDGRLARAAPGRPELDQIGVVAVKLLDRFALNPFAGLQLRRRIAHLEDGVTTLRHSFRPCADCGGGDEGQQGGQQGGEF